MCVCVVVVIAGKNFVAVGRKSTSSPNMKHTSIRCHFSVVHTALANCIKERYTLSRNKPHIHKPSRLNNNFITHVRIYVLYIHVSRVATSISSTVWCILHSSACESVHALVLPTSTALSMV